MATPASVVEAHKLLTPAFTQQQHIAANTLGHIEFVQYAGRITDALAEYGKIDDALAIQTSLYQIMAERKVIIPILEQIAERQEVYNENRQLVHK